MAINTIPSEVAAPIAFDEDTEQALKSELDAFKRGYAKDADLAVHHAGHEEAEAMEDEEVHQEQIVKQKRG